MPQTYVNKSALAHRNFRKRMSAKKIQRSYRKYRGGRTSNARLKSLERNVEWKRIVTADFITLVGAPATQIGTGVGFPIVARGDKQGQREGSRVTVKKIRISCKLNITGGAGPPNKCRVILYKLKVRTTGINDMQNVLWGLTPIAQTSNCLLHPYRKNGDVRYQILHDKIYSVGPELSTIDSVNKYFEIHHTCDTPVKWDQDDPNTDTVPPVLNSYVLCFQAMSAVAGQEIVASWNIATTYTDS